MTLSSTTVSDEEADIWVVVASTVVALIIVALSGLLVPWIIRGWLNAIVPMILYNVKTSKVGIIMLGLLLNLISTVPLFLRNTSYLQRDDNNSPCVNVKVAVSYLLSEGVGLTNQTLGLSDFIGVLLLNCCRIEEDS